MSDAPAKPTIDFFRDGEVYDRVMGRNSRVAGAAFLDWLTTPDRLSWLDVGCGTGAFSETLLAKCNPLSVSGADPSVEQIAYANAKPVAREVEFRTGDALDRRKPLLIAFKTSGLTSALA